MTYKQYFVSFYFKRNCFVEEMINTFVDAQLVVKYRVLTSEGNKISYLTFKSQAPISLSIIYDIIPDHQVICKWDLNSKALGCSSGPLLSCTNIIFLIVVV